MREWLLNVNNWSRLPKRYGHDDRLLYRNKRNILFSQITLVGGLVGIIHAVEGLFNEFYLLPLLDFLMTAVLFVGYYINESGRHLAAKVLVLSFLNVFFCVYALISPRDTGIFVFYFPWVVVAALIFDIKERFWRLLFVSLSVIFLIVLLVSDRLLVFNVLSSILITVVFIYFMIQLNETSEHRLQKLAAEIKQKNTELQRTNEQLDRFVYSASHDIKLPIIAIKGLTNLANMDCTDLKAQIYFSRIDSQADKLSAFLLEMLEYTRNSKTGVRLEQVNLNDLVDEVIDDLSNLENARRIEFKKFIRIESNVMVDRVRLMVIFNNLISNAIKFHNYALDNPWVKIMISKVNDHIQVMIADNGHGINEEYKDKVFEIFFRASNSAIGSGLGLFIVKETVEKMNGKIMLSSTEGEGACFRIDLPLVA